MKQKIKLMKQEPLPSDEEIKGYMNFDSLLEKQKLVVNSNKINSILRWSMPAVIVSLFVIWFLVPKDSMHPVIVKQSEEQLDSSAKPGTGPAGTNDSLSTGNGMSLTPAVEKPAIQPSQTKKLKEQESVGLHKKEGVYLQAEPLHGYPDLYDYFNANLVYPTDALKDSIQGIQTISFIINEEGKPEKMDVAKSLGEPFEKEAKRLIENMPPWKAAILNGKPVASKISLPLTFQIQRIKK